MQFPWQIIRRSRLASIHARSKTLDATNRELHNETVSLRLTVKRREQEIELLREKSSRVGISKLQNEIVRLHEKVSHLELSQSDASKAPVLPSSLVSTPEGDEGDDFEHPDLFEQGRVQPVPGAEVRSGDVAQQEGV